MDESGQYDEMTVEASQTQHRLSQAEREQLATAGYVVRESVFDAGELDRIRTSCEAMVQRLVETAGRMPRIPAGSYLFQGNRELCAIVKWEPDHPDVVQGVEPFAHFDPDLRAWGEDPRFTDPMKDLLGVDEVELFTEKLNLKRARVGGPIVLHQDYPYWTEVAQDAGEIATAILFLDDAHRGNGGLEVLPGSHRHGLWKGKDIAGFGKFELAPGACRADDLVMLEVPAGSVVFFGSLLVHRSTPNRSNHDRRTLLYSHQPSGRVKSYESFVKMLRK